MDEEVVSFLRKVYREHYFKNHNLVEIPSMIASREFGYIPFGGGMIRHLSFKNPGELFAELVKQGPSSVFCSNAIYERPTLQMDEKGWKGADLIFDIDADSIPTPCKTRHTWWYCNVCHKGGMGTKPTRCPNCKDASVEQMHWSCRECLNATKVHMKRLVDFLQNDFGIDRQGIRLYFSGNRGYHAQVRDERFETADPQMRTEIANYVRGTGLSLKVQDKAPDHAEFGWGRRTSLFLSCERRRLPSEEEPEAHESDSRRQRSAHRRIRDHGHPPGVSDAGNPTWQLRAFEDENRVAGRFRPAKPTSDS